MHLTMSQSLGRSWSMEVETFEVDVKDAFDCVPVAQMESVGGS